MRLEVWPEQLRTAAEQLAEVITAIERLGADRRLESAAGAVTGGLLSQAAAAAADGWRRERSRVVAELARRSTVLAEAAERYAAVESRAAEAAEGRQP